MRRERELRRNGLDDAVILMNAEKFAEPREGRWFLAREAYLPTGVALGCPLPPPIGERLRRLTGVIDRKITALASSGESALMLVPPASVHATVVNRSHFEFTSSAFLNADEYDRAARSIGSLRLKTIELFACGFLITAWGKIVMKCLPADDALLLLRQCLTESVPSLRVNVPRAAHMKIAHLRIPLTPESLTTLQAWLKHADDHVVNRIVFTDVYTPRGRIAL